MPGRRRLSGPTDRRRRCQLHVVGLRAAEEERAGTTTAEAGAGGQTAAGPSTDECDRLRRLAGGLLAGMETEHARLASDLRHEIAQHLTALKLRLDLVRAARDREAMAVHVDQARELVDEMAAWVRRLSVSLHPEAIYDSGLLASLTGYLEQAEADTGHPVRFSHEGLERQLPTMVAAVAFRVVQQLLAAAGGARPAQGPALHVWCDGADLGLYVEVDSDVLASDGEAWRRTERCLTRARELAASLTGVLEMESGAPGGVRISVVLPMLTDLID